MTPRPGKMVCPQCSQEMNHHADKLADPVNPQEAAQLDPELDGILEGFHCCPECGKSELRRAD